MNKRQKLETILKKYSYLKSRIIILEKEKNLSFYDPFMQENQDVLMKIPTKTNELEQIKDSLELVDVALTILKDYNERYRVILENHYIKGVRMEDIAETIHTSRSRCYELCKEALTHMANMIFGEEEKESVCITDEMTTNLR